MPTGVRLVMEGVKWPGCKHSRGPWGQRCVGKGPSPPPPPQEAALLCCSQSLPSGNAGPALSDLLFSPEYGNPGVYMKYPNFQILAATSAFCFIFQYYEGQTKQVCRLDPGHRPLVCSLWPEINAWVWLHFSAHPSSHTDLEQRTDRKRLFSVGLIPLRSV